MRSRIQTVVLPSEAREFDDELRVIFEELGPSEGASSLSGECSPAIDVYETDEALQIAMDLPGVAPDAIRIVVKGGTVLIAGRKAPRRGRGEASFHLVERGFGRFARAVRLTSPCDTSRAQATLDQGELRVSLPKIAERRGRAARVPVAPGRPLA
jgi:HSP20 family protein